MRRYGFAEVAGLVTALVGSSVVFALTGNDVAAAYGAVLGENVGFYGLILAREFTRDARVAHARGESYDLINVVRTAGDLMFEFGPAELLDSLLIRPAAIGFGMHFLGRPWGVVVGKLAADVLFYVPVIVAYETQRRIARARETD
ncbi:MAG: hypothetical protein JWL61_2805 [Gemmatimonadetes bacterium]|nr:hypothetical protein [Gemmatimonadota bacterium]